MKAQENKTIFLQFLEELGKGNAATVDEVFSKNFVFHSPSYPGWPRGLEGARQLATAVVEHRNYKDGHTKLDDVFAVDDQSGTAI